MTEGGEVVGAPAVVSLSLPAEAEYLSLGRLVLAGLATVRALTEDELSDLKLALTEACANVVLHAYSGSAEGRIELLYELSDDALTIVVADDGRGLADPEEHDADRPGLGLPLIRALSDQVDIGPGAGGTGTVVRLTRSLAPEADRTA